MKARVPMTEGWVGCGVYCPFFFFFFVLLLFFLFFFLVEERKLSWVRKYHKLAYVWSTCM